MSQAPTGFDPNAEPLFVEPPSWPKVIGIMSIIFGAISVFCGGIGAAFLPFQAGMMESMLEGAPPPPSMNPSALTYGLMAASLLINVLLVVAGIFCVLRNPVARLAHLGYVLVFIPVVIATAVNTMNVQKATEAWAVEYPDNMLAQQTQQQVDMGLNTGLITAIVTIVISLAWPLFCIIWFGFVKTKPNQMTGQPDEADPFTNPA